MLSRHAFGALEDGLRSQNSLDPQHRGTLHAQQIPEGTPVDPQKRPSLERQCLERHSAGVFDVRRPQPPSTPVHRAHNALARLLICEESGGSLPRVHSIPPPTAVESMPRPAVDSMPRTAVDSMPRVAADSMPRTVLNRPAAGEARHSQEGSKLSTELSECWGNSNPALGPLGLQRSEYSMARTSDWQHLMHVCEDAAPVSSHCPVLGLTLSAVQAWGALNMPPVSGDSMAHASDESMDAWLKQQRSESSADNVWSALAASPRAGSVTAADNTIASRPVTATGSVQSSATKSVSGPFSALPARTSEDADTFPPPARERTPHNAAAHTISVADTQGLRMDPQQRLDSEGAALIPAHRDATPFQPRSYSGPSEVPRRSALGTEAIAQSADASGPFYRRSISSESEWRTTKEATAVQDPFKDLLREDTEVASSYATAAQLMSSIGCRWNYINVLKVDKVPSLLPLVDRFISMELLLR